VDEDELAAMQEALDIVRPTLRPEALLVIEEKGAWEETSPGYYATTCVGSSECVFVVYDGPVAKCSIQKAHFAGKLDFAKPISCHLYPVRIENMGEWKALNYERIAICAPAIPNGRREGVKLPNFLRDPLVRIFGEEWYALFVDACDERRRLLRSD
jgi:hypothetical protein